MYDITPKNDNFCVVENSVVICEEPTELPIEEQELEQEIIELTKKCRKSDLALREIPSDKQNEEKRTERNYAIFTIGIGCIITPKIFSLFIGENMPLLSFTFPFNFSLMISDILMAIYTGMYLPFAAIGIKLTNRSYKKTKKQIEKSEIDNALLKAELKEKEQKLEKMKSERLEKERMEQERKNFAEVPVGVEAIPEQKPPTIYNLFFDYLKMKNDLSTKEQVVNELKKRVLSEMQRYLSYLKQGLLEQKMLEEGLSKEEQQFVKSLLTRK